MARKKSGLNPEAQEDGGLFGDLTLVYEDDVKEAPDAPAGAKIGGKSGRKKANPPEDKAVQPLLLDEAGEETEAASEETGETHAPSPAARERAVEDAGGEEVSGADESDGADDDDAEEGAAEEDREKGASPLGARVDEVMTGGVESDGQLTLARYASRA